MGFLTRYLPILLIACLAGCQGLAIERGMRLSPAAWPGEGAGTARLQSIEEEIRPPLEQAWLYKCSAGFGPGSALLAGDVVIVANRHGEVHTVRARDGRRLGYQRFGDAVEGTPVLAGDHLFIPISWGGKAVSAVDLRTGHVFWTAKGVPVEAGLLHTGQIVVAGDVEKNIYGLDPATGERRWTYQISGRGAIHAAAVQASDGRVVVADDQGTALALDPASGKPLWTTSLGFPVYNTGSAATGMIVFSGTRGRAAALDERTGAVRWSTMLADSTVRLTAPSVMGEKVVIAGSDGIVRALRLEDGRTMWSFQTEAPFSAAPVTTGNVIYVGGQDKNLYALDAGNGTLLWKTELRGRIKSALAASDGRVIVMTEPNLVYSFKQVNG